MNSDLKHASQIPKPKTKQRLVSLDTLRGLDMFIITGGEEIFMGLAVLLGLNPASKEFVFRLFQHAGWNGFQFYDLVFPLFLFMSGVSMPFSLQSKLAKGATKKELHWKLIKRMVLLTAIGISFSAFSFDLESIRFFNVLSLIGMAYYVGGVIMLYRNELLSQILWSMAILLAYQAATYWINYPGKIFGQVTPGNHLAGFLDQHLLQSNLYLKVFDPEGSIRFIPAAVLVTLGAMAGQRIRRYAQATLKCAIELCIGGAILIAIGLLWDLWFPINKSIWSSSFILFTAGLSACSLGLFYALVDLWKVKWLAFIFLPIGMNSITIYAGVRYFNFKDTSYFFLSGIIDKLGEHWDMFLANLGMVIIQWFILYFLYKQRIFLKV